VGLSKVQAYKAWDFLSTAGGSGIILAVVDSGIDLAHPDFACPGKLVPGWDFVSGDAQPQDDFSFGTARTCRALPAPVPTMPPEWPAWPGRSSDAGEGARIGRRRPLSDLANGITYAVDHGADIINLSLAE